MAIVYGANYGIPTLDLNFSKNKSLIDTITGNNLITFTRSTTGTYVGSDGLIKTAAVNEARFDHNPSTGESLGLLVEEARTNLLRYSEQFNDVTWVKPLNTTVTTNTHVAPDGTTTADTINAISNQIVQTVTVVANTNYTVSVYIRKTIGATIFPMLAVNEFSSDQQRVLDTNTGQLVVRDAALNTGIQCESVGSYWRVSYSGNVGANTTLSFLIYAAASTNGSNYSGSLTGSIIAWGAQLEAGAFPTSYIPTTASTVTRAADVASITGTNFSSWYNSNAGTLLAFQRSLAGQDAYVTTTFTLCSNNPNGESINIDVTNDYNRFYVYGNGASASNQNYAPVTPGTLTKNALAYQLNNVAAVRNGGTVVTDTSVGIPIAAIDRATLGHNLIYGEQKQQTISRLTYYPIRLQNSQLQQLTK